LLSVIRTFRNKQLAQLWAGERSKIDARMHKRIRQRLDALDDATAPEDMNVPGYNFHGLQGSPKRSTRCTSMAPGASRSDLMGPMQ
jgi:proteic killer suppression protein